MKIHDEIDNYLAADLHSDLSDEEQNALHVHLVECASCRQAHQGSKIMNKVLEEKFANEKPDPAFEQRMLAGFRNRVPGRGEAITRVIVDLMRLRATQIAAVAAMILALVQVGRMITGEGATTLSPRHQFVARAQDYDARAAEYGRARTELDELNKQVDAPALSSEAKREKIKERDAKFADVQDKERELQAFAPANVAPTKMPQQASLAATSGMHNEGQPEFREERPPGAMSVPASAKPAHTKSATEKENTNGEMMAEVMAPDALANRKLIRNATVELEVAKFDEAVQKITVLVNEDRGYVATTSSEKQANGKLKGEIVVKVLPENLDRFLQKLRGLGELKNQTLGTEDITKAYFDTDARLKNARVMEQRLVDMLKKKSDDINDLAF